ncbi:MAG: substrate-binding domain-containing protein [Anaerolineaceae bacterium]|nr:substrate-binding domain-containing protein [Anaerolineaceae bacterium]
MRRLLTVFCLLMLLPLTTLAQSIPPIDPAIIVGDVLIGGSDALAPLTQRMITGFVTEGATGNIVVENQTTAEAMLRFCSGELDIVHADRLPTDDETAACESAGRAPVVMPIAADAVAVVVSNGNPFLINATQDEVQQLFGPAVVWSDVQPSWPSEPINRHLTEADSDTFNTFADAIYGGDQRIPLTAIGARFYEDLNALYAALQVDPYAIGILPASYANRNIGSVRIVSINNVQPTSDNVQSNFYPMARQFYLISHATLMQQQPQVEAFLNYYILHALEQITALGYYPIDLSSAEQAWLSASSSDTPTALPTPAVVEAPEQTVEEGLEEVVEPPVNEAVVDQALQEQLNAIQILADARSDMELFAVTMFGAERPEGWNGSLNTDDPQLALLIRLDLEILAASQLGTDVRPFGWFGAVPSSQYAIARDVRHDLELLADAIFGFSERPTGWEGPSDAIMRCDRSTQSLVGLLRLSGVYAVPNADPNSATYCDDLAQQAAVFTESSLLNRSDVTINVPGAGLNGSFNGDATIDSEFAVGFYDRGAAIRGGVIPLGTPVRVIARSYADFSNMMLIQGEGFALYVEHQSTTITPAEFFALKDAANSGMETFCNALWCE